MDTQMAERLAQRRRSSGFSQEALAAELGVSRQAVSKWERGEASPDTENLIALARLYGVTLDELLFGTASETDSAGETAGNGEAGAEHATAGDPGDTEADGPHAPRVSVSWREGIHLVDPQGDEELHIGWDGIHGRDSSGHTIEAKAAEDGVTLDGTRYESWKAAREELGHGHGKNAQARTDFERAWDRVPVWALALLAYLAGGLYLGRWVAGLEVFLAIPLYHMLGAAIGRRDPWGLIAGAYPVCVVGWFFWQAFVYRDPHPAWMAFLTIPLVEISIDWVRRRV